MVAELTLKKEDVRKNIPGLISGFLRVVGHYMKMSEKYYRYFGVNDTVKLKLGRQGNICNVFVNGLSRYLFLRPKSSDFHILDEILGSSNYIIPEDVLNMYKGRKVGLVDLGANIGISSVVLARQLLKFNIDFKGVAVEPFHANVNVLKRNLSGHRFIIVEGAVDHSSNEVGLCIPSDPLRGSALIRTGANIDVNRVQAFSISDIVSNLPSDFPLILKIDIEGAEEVLFKDPEIQKVLQRCAVVFIEDHTGLLQGIETGYFSSIHRLILDSGLRQDSTNLRDRVYTRKVILS